MHTDTNMHAQTPMQTGFNCHIKTESAVIVRDLVHISQTVCRFAGIMFEVHLLLDDKIVCVVICPSLSTLCHAVMKKCSVIQ